MELIPYKEFAKLRMSQFVPKGSNVGLIAGVLALALSHLAFGAPAVELNAVKVAPVVALKAEPFHLGDVRLLTGPFRHAMDLDHAYLLSLQPDRLLHDFRRRAGLPSSAQPYGGWMARDNYAGCGQFVGHYLSACAMMYASTGDERLKQNAAEVVAGFGECQKKLGTGFLHTQADNFTSRGEAPLGLWYGIHKFIAGLLDVYVYCDNPEALEIACRLADWAKAGADKLSEAQMQKMLETEHGGMNEALANLYAFTGREKYLTLALRFNHQEIIGPASRRQDELDGTHANTQIPKFIGAAREYELSGQESLKTAALFFWDSVVRERSYANGGHSFGEMFSAREKLSAALGPNTCETCNTYNLLKLTRHLFCWDPQAEYADYYERALYNHILASQHPTTGMMCYYLPLADGPRKYCTPEDDFWCCTGTGIENHAKYGDSIYFHQGQEALFVNLFIASELRWPAAGITLRQQTSFPEQGRTRLVFTCERPVELSLKIRHPYWATSGFSLRVNGARQAESSVPGSYATLARTWNNGDVVEVEVPFSLRTEGFRDNPRRVALMYGPLVLCAETTGTTRELPYPALLAEPGSLGSILKPVPGESATFDDPSRRFRLDAGGLQKARLKPLYRVHGERACVVYWNTYTPSEWTTIEAQVKALQARTVDHVLPGRELNEREHHLRGQKDGTDGLSWRHALDGGWFSWDLKVLPNQAQKLCVKYWGGDTGGREFDVFADAERVATVRLDNNRPGEFYEETYSIPERVTRGKEKVTVNFQARPGKMAGGVFGCRILRPE